MLKDIDKVNLLPTTGEYYMVLSTGTVWGYLPGGDPKETFIKAEAYSTLPELEDRLSMLQEPPNEVRVLKVSAMTFNYRAKVTAS